MRDTNPVKLRSLLRGFSIGDFLRADTGVFGTLSAGSDSGLSTFSLATTHIPPNEPSLFSWNRSFKRSGALEVISRKYGTENLRKNEKHVA